MLELGVFLSSSNPAVADWTLGGSFEVTALAPGDIGLFASWQEYFGHPEPIGPDLSECVFEEGTAECGASMVVQAANITISSVQVNHTEVHPGETATVTAQISIDGTLDGKSVTVNFGQGTVTGTIKQNGYTLSTTSKDQDVKQGSYTVTSVIANTTMENNGTIAISVSITSTLPPTDLKVNGSPKESPPITLKPAN
jgi:hypothetical protein